MATNSVQVQDLARRNGHFAFEFYRQAVAGTQGNVIFSPYSISLAFSMLYAGARGSTASQLADAFHFLPQNAQHSAFHELALQVSANPSSSNSGQNTGAPFQLNIANAMWGQAGFPFQDSFVKALSQDYNAEMRQVDFTRQSAEIAREINDWISGATQDRIKNMVGPGTLDSQTRLVLANAVYFKGSWQLPFGVNQTKPGTFTLQDNTPVQVPFMHHRNARIPYSENADYQAIQLSYVGDKVEMVVLLPKQGRLQTVETGLSASLFDDIRAGSELRDVVLSMPRFEFDTNLELPPLLQRLGVIDAFGSGADLTGLSEGGGLHVSAALHSSTITVDENGTEAAAATVLAVPASAFERAEVDLNRPFLFAIVERETGTILFLGRVMDPR